MKLTKYKKIFLIIALTAFVVLLFNSNTAFAAINTSYSGQDVVPDESLEEAFDGSTLLELLAKLIYAVGRFLEWILATIFKLLTGSSDFPWADKIVFNAVPLLDINFINPDTQSFVGSGIQPVLKSVYSTVLTLSVSFFGMVVLITAIKLVISTIASEKAKYKQAIVDWLVGFVMLFCIHYFISFVFYLNEQLVIVASKMVTESLNGANVKIAKTLADGAGQEVIEGAKSKGAKYNGQDVSNILEQNTNILLTWQNGLKWAEGSKGVTEGIMKDMNLFGADSLVAEKEQYERLGMVVSWASEVNVSIDELKKIKSEIKLLVNDKANGKMAQAISVATFNKIFDDHADEFAKVLELTEASGRRVVAFSPTSTYTVVFYLLKTSEEYVEDPFYYGVPTETYYDFEKDEDIEIERSNIKEVEYYISDGASLFDLYDVYGKKGHATTTPYYFTNLIDDLIIIKKSSDTGSGEDISGSGSVRLISDLATYFRYNSYSKTTRPLNKTGVTDGYTLQIQNMIMYAVLVGQSLILFIAYVKRLFYVILLAMLGPVAVVFNFFQKFGK